MKDWIQNRSFQANLLIGGLTIIFAFGLVSYGMMALFLQVDDDAEGVRLRAANINSAFLQTRRAEKDFLLSGVTSKEFHERGESRFLAQHKDWLAVVIKEIDVLARLTTNQTHVIERIRALVRQYDESFQMQVSAYREKGYKDWGTEGEWRNIIHEMERRARESKNPFLTAAVLQLRRNEKDYLLRGEDKYVDAVYADLKQLSAAARPLNIAGFEESLKRYESLFKKYLSIEERIGKTADSGLEIQLRRAADEVEPLLQEILKQATLDREAARQKLTGAGLVISVAALGIAGLFFYFFAASLSRPIENLSAAAISIGDGNLNSKVDFQSRNELGVLARGFNQMVEALSKLVGQVQKCGLQVSTSVTEIAATSKQQQATASEIAATTSEIGATSKEIYATSKELVKIVNDVSMVAEQSADLAGNGQAGLLRMEETMRRVMEASGSFNAKLAVLNEKAGNINQVVTTITKVADQTNLLSLNAAIEAEKAGEYGRGFAVVATEIRRLADQTAVATYDIEQMVKEIQSAVSAGVMGMDKFSEEVRHGMQEVQQVGNQLSQIIQQVQTLAPRFGMVNEGMQAQSTGAEQISNALMQLSEAVQQTVESLRQSGQSIDQLNQVAGDLRSGVSRFMLQT